MSVLVPTVLLALQDFKPAPEPETASGASAIALLAIILVAGLTLLDRMANNTRTQAKKDVVELESNHADMDLSDAPASDIHQVDSEEIQIYHSGFRQDHQGELGKLAIGD